jgi:hypothetical protein
LQAAKTDYDKNDIQPGSHYSGTKSAQQTPPLKCYVTAEMVPNIIQLFLDHKDQENELLVQYDTVMVKNTEND